MTSDQSPPATTVFTIGHGREDFDAFLDRCSAHGIQTIIDVRSQPHSRHAPDFSQGRLDEFCAEAGVGYRWMGRSLGGRPDDPALLTSGGEPDYEAIRSSDAFRAGITELQGLIPSSRVALLCAESDPATCHRSLLVSPALADLGFHVWHIGSRGELLPHQPPLGL